MILDDTEVAANQSMQLGENQHNTEHLAFAGVGEKREGRVLMRSLRQELCAFIRHLAPSNKV